MCSKRETWCGPRSPTDYQRLPPWRAATSVLDSAESAESLDLSQLSADMTTIEAVGACLSAVPAASPESPVSTQGGATRRMGGRTPRLSGHPRPVRRRRPPLMTSSASRASSGTSLSTGRQPTSHVDVGQMRMERAPMGLSTPTRTSACGAQKYQPEGIHGPGTSMPSTNTAPPTRSRRRAA